MPQAETLQIYESNKAMIDSQVATAKAYPRNMKRFVDNCIADISNAPLEFVQSCVYTVPRGDKKITGPSVHLATIAMQYFQNLRAEARVTDIDHKHITCEAVCFDLENNIAVKKSIKRLILNSRGERYNDDMITVTGNAGNSIALRNAVFAVIPKLQIEVLFDAVKRRIVGKLDSEEKLIAKRKTVMDALKNRYNVSEKEILFSIGKESVDHIFQDEIVALIGIETALKAGETTVDIAFKGKRPTPAPEGTPSELRLHEMLKNTTTVNQLETFKKNLKTNIDRSIYDEQLQKLKNHVPNNS